jgi:hypothetical protein
MPWPDRSSHRHAHGHLAARSAQISLRSWGHVGLALPAERIGDPLCNDRGSALAAPSLGKPCGGIPGQQPAAPQTNQLPRSFPNPDDESVAQVAGREGLACHCVAVGGSASQGRGWAELCSARLCCRRTTPPATSPRWCNASWPASAWKTCPRRYRGGWCRLPRC